MNEIIISTIIISALHALIPNHSLPIVAVGKRFSWSLVKLLFVTLLAASAHIISTLIIGVLIIFIGIGVEDQLEKYLHWITPAILIGLGIYFIYQHHTHHHFHLSPEKEKNASSRKMMFWILAAMFFSPCLEIEALFFAASGYGWTFLGLIAVIYASLSILGMLFWVAILSKGFDKFDAHKIEHNIGIITGITLVITGIAILFIH